MCGIAGILDPRGISPDREVLQRMGWTLRHRGPDGRGVHVDGPCGLAHARLSILDLAGGAQPMSIEGGDYVLTFNGEIFNYVELREELETKHGRRFATRSDTETILHAYAVWGDRCVERMNGQWAFALWDRKRRRLFCSRDRIGVRPFFWTLHEGRFLFGSEAKAVFAVPGVPRAFDPVGLQQVFTFWCAVAPRTVWQGLSELPPGCSLVADASAPGAIRISVSPYWRLEYSTDDSKDSAERAEELRDLLVDAARIRLRADVPVGAYVSGGIDSSVIAAIVRKYTGSHLDTFSVTFEEADFDESVYQREVVELLGTRHGTIAATNSRIGGAFPELAWHMETPVVRSGPAPLFLLSGLVRESGFKVVMTGEGADEVLGGYDIFREAKIRRFWGRDLASECRPRLLRRMYSYHKTLQAQPDAYLRAFFHVRSEDLDSPFFSHLPRWRLTQQVQAFLDPDFRANLAGRDPIEELRDRLPPEYATWHPFAQAQYLETTILLPGYILSSQGDRPSMAHSIEGRYPYLDARLLEWAVKLPPSQKMLGLHEKHLLKLVAADLVPPRVIEREKQPYRAPDATSFIDPETGRSRHAWVDEMLSPEALQNVGVFASSPVQKLVEKVRHGTAVGVRDNMAFVSVLSTQLVADRFLSGFESRIPAAGATSL